MRCEGLPEDHPVLMLLAAAFREIEDAREQVRSLLGTDQAEADRLGRELTQLEEQARRLRAAATAWVEAEDH